MTLSEATQVPILPTRLRGGLVLAVRVLPAAYLILAVNLLLCAARVSRGWWWQDDLNLLATAAREGLSPGLLFSGYNGHLVPGTWLMAWIFDTIAPLEWWPAAVTTIALVAAIDVSTLALLRRLFGTRPAILVPFAMVCATSLTLTSTLWWAASLQWLPVTLSLVAGLWFHVGYLQTRRLMDAAGAVACVVLGLAFFEKALTTLLVLAVFTVLYSTGGPWWRRPWRALSEHFAYWLAHAAVAGGFLALYLARVQVDTGPSPTSSDTLRTIRWMLLDTLVPSLIGGPLKWYTTPETTINAWPHPVPAVAIAAWLLTVAAIAGSVLTRRGGWRAWVLLGTFLAVSIGLVIRARLGFIGPFVGRDQRYLTDAAVLAPLCLALAWLPLRPGLDRGLPELPAPRDTADLDGDPPPHAMSEPENLFTPHTPVTSAPASALARSSARGLTLPIPPAPVPPADPAVPDSAFPDSADPDWADPDSADPPARTGKPGEVRVEDLIDQVARQGFRRGGELARRGGGAARRLASQQRVAAAAGALAVVLVTAGGAVSGESFMANWTKNPTKPYLDNLALGLASAPGPVNLLPESVVPDLIMTPTFEDDRRLSNVTQPMDPRPAFPSYADSYSVVTGQGQVRAAQIPLTADNQALVLKPFDCASSTRPAIVTFPAEQAEWRWVVRLDYLAPRDTAAKLSLGNYPAVPIRMRGGLHTMYVDLLGGGSAQLVLSDVDPGVVVCIGKAAISKELTPSPA